MWDYTDKVMEHFHQPKNQGALAVADEPGYRVVIGEVGSITCGDALRLYLKVDEKTETIIDATFQTFGCASAIASSSALTELVKGMTLEQALKLNNKQIAEFLGGLPEEKMHCSVMGQEALEAAIFKFQGKEIEHHEDDEGAILCSCFGVTDNRIKRIVLENELTTAEQVTNYIKAGGGCGSCLVDIDDLIEVVYNEKRAQEATQKTQSIIANNINPIRLTPIQKINLIQQVLEQEVRPVLKEDGGDIELYDVDGDIVKVILKGACGGCSSSNATLKMAVEARLQEKVSPELIVIPV